MSVISLHAAAYAEAVGRDDLMTGDALEHIRTASTRSLQELRSMVRILRSTSDADASRSFLSLSAAEGLAESAKGAGVEVTTDIAALPSELTAPADAAAYRVIQESITNVIRRSGAIRAHVQVGIRDGRLHVTVTDNGRGSATDTDAKGGFVLAGMSERVRQLGGSLATRSLVGTGFVVEAMIPVRLS